MKTINAHCIRTQMCGGGTSYAVYFRTTDKPSHPLHGSTSATTIRTEGADGTRGSFFEVIDAIDPRSRWSMEKGWDKYEAYKRLEKKAKRLAVRIAKRAFPELRGRRELPLLWAQWTLPHAAALVPVRLALPE